MKIYKVFIICIMLCFSFSTKAQFDGNFGDGFSVDTSIKNFLSDGQVAIYIGGVGDGFAVDQSIKNFLTNGQVSIYFGGNGDGFSVDTSIKNLLLDEAIAIYFGGNGDGFSVDTSIKNLLSDEAIAIYFGGNGDGFSVATSIKNLLSDEAIAIYFGGNGDGYASSDKTAYLIEQIKANVVAFLQGPILNSSTPGLMNDILREDNLLPTTSPYADGSSVNPTVFNTIGDDAIVDWVWIELRDDTDVNTVISSRSALLQRDGDIVDLNGSSNITIEVQPKEYYVVIKHRNHLGVMSASPINLTPTSTTIDFTDSTFPTFGNNAQVILGSGNKALWAGDAGNTKQIVFSGGGSSLAFIRDYILADPANIFNSVTFPSAGYFNIDVDLNGIGRFSGSGSDTSIIRDNVLANPGNIFNSVTFPINTTVPPEN